MSNEKDLNLPVFNAPVGFVNMFMMDTELAIKIFKVNEATAENILNTFCQSIMQNSIAVEREHILKENLSVEEYNRYLETGFFSYNGKDYNEEGEEL